MTEHITPRRTTPAPDLMAELKASLPQRCNRCGRWTYARDDFDTEDRMTQPDGNPCGGKFEARQRPST